MPIVPSEFVPTVQPQGALTYADAPHATPADFGGQVGQTLQQAGNMLEQHALERQQLLNETTVNDLYANQFAPAFRDLYNKFYQLQGKDPEQQFESYQQQMEDLRSGFKDQLKGPIQQKLFDTITRQRMNYELDGMARHAAQQTQVYHLDTSNALLGNFVNDGIDKYNDPRVLQNRENSINVETAAYGRQYGQSPEESNRRAQHYIDQMYKGAIERAAETDPTAALSIYKQYQPKLSGDMQREMERYLHPYQETIQAQRAFGVATGGPVASKITSEAAAQGYDPGKALTIWSCEGAVINPETKNPKSSATGHFQVLDDTWKDWGGTAQDRLDSNVQIQQSIVHLKQNDALLSKDLGRQPQTWESYLAWQQGVKGAENLLHADPNANAGQVVGDPNAIIRNGGTKDTTVGQFLTISKGYVDRHSQMYDAQGLPTAQNIRENYQTGIDTMRQLARQEHPGDPSAEDKYVSFYIQHATTTLHAEQMTDQANRDIINSGLTGLNGAKSWPDFEADPRRVQAYASIYMKDPSIRDRIDDAIKINANKAWDPQPSAETDTVYKELKGMQLTDRTKYAGMDLSPYYGAVPISQFNELARDQDAIRKNDAATAQKHVNLEHAEKVLKSTFNEAIAQPNSPYKFASKTAISGDGAKKYNQYLGNLSNAIDNWRQNNGGKLPSDTDLLQIGRTMLWPAGDTKPGGMTNVQASTNSASGANVTSSTAKYETFLTQHGYPVTPANIKALQDQQAIKVKANE